MIAVEKGVAQTLHAVFYVTRSMHRTQHRKAIRQARRVGDTLAAADLSRTVARTVYPFSSSCFVSSVPM